jgi:hypothetical protein
MGGMNLQVYAANPVSWVDPLGWCGKANNTPKALPAPKARKALPAPKVRGKSPSQAVDTVTGTPIGRFYVHSNGNTLIEPVGGGFHVVQQYIITTHPDGTVFQHLKVPNSGVVNNAIPPHTEVRFGPDGQVYAKLPAPSNPEVNRWQRMNPNGTSNRRMYMGGTPGKESRVGLQVQDRMRNDGSLVGAGDARQVLGEDGNWYPINQTDMGHIESAVDYWNRLGHFQGARSPEVRTFMNDPDNYLLEPSTINRSKGGSSGSRYLPEATEAEKKAFYDIDELE